MSEVEVLEQLYDLISDRKVFIEENQDDCSVFKKDIIALETIIENYKHNEICLSGYRESILRRSDNNLDLVEDVLIQNQKLKQENERLKEQLSEKTRSEFKLKDELLKKRKEYQETYKDVRTETKEYKQQLKQRGEIIKRSITNWNELEKYIDENKMVLNNPNIFQFYLIQKEILQQYKGDNNE